jgi:hypothetical protein
MFAGGFGGDSGASGAPGGPSGSVSDGLSALGGFASGLSALGMIGQNADIAQAAQALGQVATLGTAANQAAQGDIGQAAMTVAPTIGQALGIPGIAIGMGMTAAQAQSDPTMSSNLTMGSLASQAINAAVPGLGLISAISGLIGGPTTKSIANDAITDALADQANALAQVQSIDPLDALMNITDAFGTADSGIATGETGVSAVGEADAGGPGSGGGPDNGGDSGGGASSAGTAADGGAAAAASASGDSSAAGPAGDGAGGGGGSGAGGCVIATHAVNAGAFTPRQKKKAIVWCTRALHNKWWGESIRRGYRHLGNRAIAAGTAQKHYKEFMDFVDFGAGTNRTAKTAYTFIWRSVQFFVVGLFVKN